MNVLAKGLFDANNHSDALSVYEAQLSTYRRLGASAHSILDVQSNLSATYLVLGRSEEALSMRRDVYNGHLKLHGKDRPETLVAANNYAASLLEQRNFKEVKALLRIGQATEVHAPGVGTVPVPAGEPRYVFHDIASRRYWGRWDAAARAIRYPDARRRGDDDDDAIPMGFGVGHPSFKAAFPVSESWGS